MSAVEAQRRDLPETTVKNRSGYSTRLHRQAPDADAPAPACCERERSGAEYREVSTSHYYPAFADLCQNPACFGEPEVRADGAGLTTADLDVALSTTDLLLGADLNGVRIAVTASRTTEAGAVADALAAARPAIHEGWQRARSLQPPLSASAYEAIQADARADGGLGALDRADELLARVVDDVEGETVHRLIQARQLLAVAQNGDGR
jgi:hypothetical protein